MTLPPCLLDQDLDAEDAEQPRHDDTADRPTQRTADRAADRATGHPPDPSRRAFVLGSAAATAGVLVSPLLSGGPAPPAVERKAPIENAVRVVLDVNGKRHELTLDPRTTLLDALREQLDLTGTKKGCDQGACGACTVLVDGRRINSCLTLAVMHGGQRITTIEGIAEGGNLHPVQAAFIRNDGFQCGYCTPGQICSAVALLHEGHTRNDDEIREWMSGNVCRCGAYVGIVAAVREAAKNGGGHAAV
jgi:xanthine dehydrogenase YagT iron-sulfur-binding subunit